MEITAREREERTRANQLKIFSTLQDHLRQQILDEINMYNAHKNLQCNTEERMSSREEVLRQKEHDYDNYQHSYTPDSPFYRSIRGGYYSSGIDIHLTRDNQPCLSPLSKYFKDKFKFEELYKAHANAAANQFLVGDTDV